MSPLKFNEQLLGLRPELKNNNLNLSLIYEDACPLYFSANESEPDTNEQLKLFKSSPLYPVFQQQYATLVQKLNQHCARYEILIKIQPNEDENPTDDSLIPAFSLFQQRLFGEADYYSIRKAMLFNTGKSSLEELVLLLDDESIMRPIKEKILLNLQKSIVVCADGTLTNIVDAKDDLTEAHEGIAFLITNTLRTLIQQSAVEHSRATYSESELSLNTLHYVNAYSNYVAETYGIAQKNDGFISALYVPTWRLQQFARRLDELITPKIVLKSLMHAVSGYLALLREHVHERFFKERTAVPLTESSTLCNAGNKLIATWNSKYDVLLPLDTNCLFQLSDDGNTVVPAPYDEAPLRKIIAQKFGALFLIGDQKKVSLKMDSGSKLVIGLGLYWKEEGIDVLEFKSAELACLERNQPDSLADLDDYNELIETFPEHAHALIRRDAGAANYNPQQLLQKGHLALLLALIDAHPLAQSQIAQLQSRRFAKLMNTYVSPTQQLHLLEKLTEHQLLSPKVLRLGWPGILATPSKKQQTFVETLLKQKCLTRELCARIETREQEFLGVNIIWLLAAHECFVLIDGLRQQKLLTTKSLAAAPKKGVHAGKNVAWLLAYHEQDALLEQLFAQGLLTSELLAATPSTNEAGASVLWLLAQRQCFTLIKKLIDKKLITTKMLAAAPANLGDRSFFWFLINYRQEQLLEKLCSQGLFTPQFLATVLPENSVAAGGNNVWLLAIHRQFNLLKQLLDKRLLTLPMLAAAPEQGDNAGINTFWLLAKMNQIELIEELCRQNLLSNELLAAVPNDKAGTNAVYELALQQCFSLIETLLNKGLLSKEIIAAAPQAGPNKDKNLLVVLIEQNQFTLVEKLVAHKLLTPEALRPPRYDVLSMLASKQHDSLIHDMKSQGLVDSQEACPPFATISRGESSDKYSTLASTHFTLFSSTSRMVNASATARLKTRVEKETSSALSVLHDKMLNGI